MFSSEPAWELKMISSSYGDEQSFPPNHHSIRVFTRPFLEYSTSYPSPLEGNPAPEGGRVDIALTFPNISPAVSVGYWLRIAAMRHKRGHVRVDGMRLLELCANLDPAETIQIQLSYGVRGTAYFKDWESVYLAKEALTSSQIGFVMPVTELQ